MLTSGTNLGPYEIVALLGAGGMGEVYRARDTRLGRDVAIKVLPAEFAADPDRLRRFEQEAQAVAALNHPNIVSLYDIGTYEGSPYLVSELLEGESLRQRLTVAPLPPPKAMELAVQIAQGLAAAHEKGIVHRDLKPENLFITRDGQAKILDFGVAKLLPKREPAERSVAPTVLEGTDPGIVMGTAGYMSPEQVRGLPVDHRSDIFSFGCVLYEMVTGRRAFARATAADTMAAILTEEPPDPSGIHQAVPPPLSRVIAHCLEKQPEERFQSARDLAFELRAILADTGGAEARQGGVRVRGRTHVLWLAAGGVAAATAVAVGLLLWSPWKRSAPVATFDPKRVVVAVFENRIGDASLDSLGLQIADALTNDLLQTGELKVTTDPLASGQHAKGGTARAGEPGADPVRRLAEITGSALVVAGAYYLRGDQLEVQARLVEPRQGKLVYAAAPGRVSRADPLGALEPLRQRMAGAAAWSLVEMPRVTLGAIRPPRFDALAEYRLGIAAFGRDWEATTAHFVRALTLDPEFDWAKMMQFWACESQGRNEEAARLLGELEGAVRRMTECERALVRYCRAGFDGHPLDELAAAREVDTLSGGAPGFRWNTGVAEMHVNRPADAVRTLSSIPSDWAAPGDFLGYWPMTALARAYHMNGDYKGQLRVAQEGLQRFPDVLDFYSHEVAALAALGRLDEIEKVVEDCQSVPRRPSAGTPGSVMITAAMELRAHGHREASLRMANHAVEWRRGLPPAETRTVSAREALFNALYWAERWSQAQDIAAELAKERPGDVDDLGTLATLAVRLRRPAEARRIEAELAAVNRPYLHGDHTYWRARIAAQLGEKERAVALLREAFSQGYGFPISIHRDMDLEPLWDYPPFQELLKPKG